MDATATTERIPLGPAERMDAKDLERTGQGRQPPKAGARSASLEPGISLVYFTVLTGNPPCDSISRRRYRVHRIPSRVRDDARSAPLAGKGRGELVELICPTAKAVYFLREGWTTQIKLKCLEKFAYTRIGFSIHGQR